MLVFKAAQIIVATREEPKDWDMGGKKGTTHPATLCCLGFDGKASNIKIKAKTEDELNAKIAQLTIGKPYDLPIVEVIPVFKTGDRRASGFELVADIKIFAKAEPTNTKKP